MGVPNWPILVPHENEASGSAIGASFAPGIESETEAGTSLQRPVPGPRATVFSWRSVPLCEAEWAALDEFLRVTLVQGTRMFQMPIYRPDSGYVSRYCQIKKGSIANDFSEVVFYRTSFTLTVFNW